MKDHLREQIIRMAMLAGFSVDEKSHKYQPLCIHHTHYMVDDLLTNFDALVRADEREVIAQSLDKQADLACDEIDRQWAQEMAAAVRARGNT